MFKWERTGKSVSAEGITITYQYVGTEYSIESRKRYIPHAGGRPGTWELTTYFILKDGKEVIERFSLKDAKEYVEKEVVG